MSWKGFDAACLQNGPFDGIVFLNPQMTTRLTQIERKDEQTRRIWERPCLFLLGRSRNESSGSLRRHDKWPRTIDREE